MSRRPAALGHRSNDRVMWSTTSKHLPLGPLVIIQTAVSLGLLGACAQLGWAGVILRVIPQATTTPNPIG